MGITWWLGGLSLVNYPISKWLTSRIPNGWLGGHQTCTFAHYEMYTKQKNEGALNSCPSCISFEGGRGGQLGHVGAGG